MSAETDIHGDAWTARLRREHERHAGIPGASHATGAEAARDAASEARHWSRGFTHGAYDYLQTLAMSDPDAADFLAAGLARFVPVVIETPAAALERLRRAIRAERISYGELAELQDLAEHIEPGDVELLEWAGVPEDGLCGGCGHAVHWRACAGPQCYCRRRGPHGEAPA